MNVLLLGSGGREHALAWKLAQSPRVERIVAIPGNAGLRACPKTVCMLMDLANLPVIFHWARANGIDFLIPGPENVLAAGVVDLAREAGIKAFGPGRSAAQIETSKIFAKNLMRRHGIPTADYAVFEQHPAALHYLESREEGPLVVKADGLCAGKGVMVCQSREEAKAALERCMVRKEFGPAGERVVMEECLRGREVSLLVLTDGHTIDPLAPAQDHKAAFDGDMGPNTGGMGAYSPAPILTEAIMDEVVSRILVPTVHALNDEGKRFRGVLFVGLMLTGGGPKVLEYNARFGDPETQVILPRLENDLMELLLAVTDGGLHKQALRWRPEASVCVVMAAQGYPGAIRKGDPIAGLERAAARADTLVFHAGTSLAPDGRATLTAGGRVLGVTALGADIGEAARKAYEAVGDLSWPGAHWRTDIGAR